jgi:putative lipoic acid-binding regulatory protein
MKKINNGLNTSEKLKFPVQFDLKVIMESPDDHQNHIDKLENILNSLSIAFHNWRYKPSEKGTYTSYTVNVYVITQKKLKDLFAELKTIPEVKMAI